MLMTESPTSKAMYSRMQAELQDNERKIKSEYAEYLRPSDKMFFNFDHIQKMLSVVFDNKPTKQAYQVVQEEFKLDREYINKARKRHASVYFEQAIVSFTHHPMAELLRKYNMFKKGYLKLYHQEVVSTGLARLANNIKIVTDLEKSIKVAQDYKFERDALQLKLNKLEAEISVGSSNWFEAIALPMHNNGDSIKDIVIKTGQKSDTIRSRLRRENLKQKGQCPA